MIATGPIIATGLVRQASQPPSARHGLTLFEVVLATVILAGGLAVLTPILETSRQASVRAAVEAEALNRARSLMGLAVAQASFGTPETVAADADDWTETLDVESGQTPGLLTLTATVEHTNDAGNTDGRVRLVRMVYAPAAITTGGAATTGGGL